MSYPKKRDDWISQLPTEEMLTRVTDAIYALDSGLEFTYINRKAETLLDRSTEELVGKTIHEAFPAISGSTFESQCRQALEMQSPVAFEEHCSQLDTWFEVLAYPSEGGLSVFFTSSAEQRRRSRKLKRYERIVETVDDGIFSVDTDGRMLEVNDAYVDLTGYSREELLSEPPGFLVDDAVIHEYEEVEERLLSGDRDAITMSADVTTADGDRVPTETTLSPVTFEHESGIIGVVRDVRSRQQYPRQVELLHETTRDVMEATTKAEVGEVLVEATDEILELPAITVYFWDEEEGCLVPEACSEQADEVLDDPPTFPGGESLAWDAFIEGEVRVYDDVSAEERCFNPGTRFRSELFAPLGDHGLLVSATTEPGFYESTHVDLASLLAANATAALDRVARQERLTDRQGELEEQTRRLENLVRTNNVVRDSQQALVNASARTEAVESICENLVTVDPYCFAWVGDTSPPDGVRPEAWAGRDGEFLDHLDGGDDAGAGPESPAERVLETGEPVTVNSVFDAESFPRWRKAALQRGYQSAVTLPLASNGTVDGVLEVYATEANAFEDDQEEVFFELGDIVADGLAMIEQRQIAASANDVELRFESSADESFLGRIAGRADAELDVDSATLRDDGTWLLYLTVSGSDAGTVSTAFEGSTIVENVRHIRADSEQAFFGVVLSEFAVGRTLTEYGATLTGLVATADRIELELRVAPNVSVRELIDAYRTVLPAVELVGREAANDETDAESRRSSLDALTDRQREVLRTAYNEGFFEWPRETSGEEIADMLDISNPVFHRHVRRALQKQVASQFGSDSAPG